MLRDIVSARTNPGESDFTIMAATAAIVLPRTGARAGGAEGWGHEVRLPHLPAYGAGGGGWEVRSNGQEVASDNGG